MEEFLQNLKTLRYQMNDVEDQAAKLSVEEQMQITTIQTLQKDLDSAKSETIRVKEDTDLMMKAKGQICSQVLEKQRKIATLESDSCTLSQVRHSIELMKSKIDDYKPEFQEMDNKSLEEEIQALLSDKAAETEYMQSLQNQIEILKGISHVVKCNCGVEYKIDLVSAY